MTEHKFTDDEIIRALECCIEPNGANCKECPYDICCTVVESIMLTDVLNLINRQKAEIESLKAEIDKQYEQAEADILGNMSDGGTSCHWCIDGHRTAAIKEFAKKLHKYIDNFREKREMVMLPYTEAALLCIEKCIDNLVKEMTEGKE